MPSTEENAQRILARVTDGAIVAAEPRADDTIDLMLRSRGDGPVILIEAKWAGSGGPVDVRAAVERVPDPWPARLVILAERFSPSAVEWLRARDANWADATGQARILGPDGLIVVRDADQPAAPLAFRWSVSGVSIAEFLLARPSPRIQVTDLAEASGWAPSRVTNVLTKFDAQGWTEKRGGERGPGAHRVLADPAGLLDAWSAELPATHRHVRLGHRAGGEALALLDGLAPELSSRVPWALSGWAALEQEAPLMTAVPTLHVYVDGQGFARELTEAMNEAGLREVRDGARVIFWAADATTLALSRRDRGRPIVSAPRLYADLAALGARGIDAAAHVKEELVDPPIRAVAHDEDSPPGS